MGDVLTVEKPGTLIGIYVTIAEYDALQRKLTAALERVQKAEAKSSETADALHELDYSLAYCENCYSTVKEQRDEARTWAQKLYHNG